MTLAISKRGGWGEGDTCRRNLFHLHGVQTDNISAELAEKDAVIGSLEVMAYILCVQEVATHFFTVSYCIKLATTSWTYSMYNRVISRHFDHRWK